MDTDSSEEEEDEVQPVSNSNKSSTNSTGVVRSPWTHVCMQQTTTVQNLTEQEKEQVQNIHGHLKTEFSEKKNDANFEETAFVTYAVEDVENIDNINFDDTDNSLLGDDEEADVWE